MSSFRSGTNSAGGAFAFGMCRPYGAQKNGYQCLTQGLRPGLCRGIALAGLIYVITTNQLRRAYCACPMVSYWLSLVLHKYTYLCKPINEDVIEQ